MPRRVDPGIANSPSWVRPNLFARLSPAFSDQLTSNGVSQVKVTSMMPLDASLSGLS